MVHSLQLVVRPHREVPDKQAHDVLEGPVRVVRVLAQLRPPLPVVRVRLQPATHDS